MSSKTSSHTDRNTPDSSRYLVVDIGGTYIKSGVVPADGNIRYQPKIPTPPNYPELLSCLQELISSVDVNGAVLAVPGVYSHKDDVVVFAPNLPDLAGRQLRQILATENMPVFVENDANLAALGEYYHGFDTPPDSMVFLTLGTGFGGGVVTKGQLMTGPLTSTELGHVTLLAEGRQCGCGKRGCIEKYCTTSTILEDYRALNPRDPCMHVSEVTLRAEQGDRAALEVFELFSRHLAHAVSSLINIFTPECMRIGGGLSEISPWFYPRLLEYVNNMVFPAYKGFTDIAIASLKNDAALLGGYYWAEYSINKSPGK